MNNSFGDEQSAGSPQPAGNVPPLPPRPASLVDSNLAALNSPFPQPSSLLNIAQRGAANARLAEEGVLAGQEYPDGAGGRLTHNFAAHGATPARKAPAKPFGIMRALADAGRSSSTPYGLQDVANDADTSRADHADGVGDGYDPFHRADEHRSSRRSTRASSSYNANYALQQSEDAGEVDEDPCDLSPTELPNSANLFIEALSDPNKPAPFGPHVVLRLASAKPQRAQPQP